jgi:hypothetical protein
MDQLENIANKAEGFEKQTAESQSFEPVNDSPGAGAVPFVDPLEAAKNRAEILLQTLGVAAKSFIDTRLEMPPEEIAAGKEGLGPLLAKYNLAGDGDGKLPYQEEITAGLYLGGLWRRFRRALASLRAFDKAEAEKQKQQDQANNGDQRKHQSQEQPQPVSGEVGVRQEPDIDSPGWLSRV